MATKPKEEKKRGGARPGAGRPSARQEADLRVLMNEAFPHADRVAVVKEMVRQAKQGNVKAAVALLDRVFGKPTQYVEQTSETALKIAVDYADPEPSE
jgi:hypothetical protein